MAYNPYQNNPYGSYTPQFQPRADNTQQWQQPPQNVQQPTINSRAVTGIEEAIASPVSFDGSVSVFTDFGHGKVYTKQLNYQDGSAIFRTYALEQPSQAAEQPPIVEYAPMSEIDALKAKISELEAVLKPKAKGAVDK